MIWFPLGIFALIIILGLTFVPASKRSSGFIFSCVLALLFSFLVSFLYSFIKNTYPLTDDLKRIMLHYLIHDHLFFYYPGAVTVLICLLCIRKDFTRAAAAAAGLVFFSFYMFLAMLASFFYSSHGNWADPYLLFYLTGSRVLQCLVFALLVHFIILKSRWFFLLPALLIILVVPFITAQISYFYYTCNVHMATVLMAFLYGAVMAASLAGVILAWRLKA